MVEKSIPVEPSETVFTRTEWQKIIDGAGKRASADEKQALRTILAKKFPTKTKVKPGRKGNEPTDRARRLHQHYLWMIRELLGLPDSTDAEACTRAALAIHNFDRLSKTSIFLRSTELNAIDRSLHKLKSEDLTAEDDNFHKILIKRRKPTQKRQWNELFKGEISHLNGVGENITTSPLDISTLINGILPKLLNIGDAEFQVFSGNRLRSKSSGRPKQIVDDSIEIHAKGRSRRFSLKTGYVKQFENCATAQPEDSRPAIKPPQDLNPAPTEEEILRKTVSRLILAKNLIHYRFRLPLGRGLKSSVLNYERKNCAPKSINVQSICGLLWEAGRRQPISPWVTMPTNEDAGGLMDIPKFGLLEIDY